ncbi:ATP-binding protein [Novosphingobium sp.]|uniref:sensor histidine kinase n=1 Tax=Novosphingobium sp. TaxID=1874826 RepID=UPI002733A622|nr:ATP-binding protein [Novosphingobium sp.]MDP3907604.1 ATP-binding protein [Novosphingobium sp.]
MLARLWPRSLQGQLLLAIALALLLAQGISAALLWRAQAERREAALIHSAAIRIVTASRDRSDDHFAEHRQSPRLLAAARQLRIERLGGSPLRPGERREHEAEEELAEILTAQGMELTEVVVVHRPLADDLRLASRLARQAALLGNRAQRTPDNLLVAAVAQQSGGWLLVRVPVPRGDPALLASFIGQTLLLFALLVGAIALIVGRITRPLAALTRRLEQFAATRAVDGQMPPEGPDDIRRLIVAHNAMEARIGALLDEKDVMLGAIGHDLKTPLTALRVRIESVEDETERAKMAATIEDIVRSLDDILSLARVGRPSDPREPTELSALVANIAEEFEDMGEPVSFAPSERIVVPLRTTWLRRALRNLVSNALRYGQTARVTLTRENGFAVIRVEDDGPGIPDADLDRMLEPFTRGDPSRNSVTGGAGLGLTLARAIAEQHGGRLTLANRRDAAGGVSGLIATLTLPLG